MKWNEPYQVGLVQPHEEPKSVNDMRQIIQRQQRDSALISRALDAGRYGGLSGEDTYAMLAYYALRQLEDEHRMLMKLHLSMPSPAIVELQVPRNEVQREG